MGRSEIEALIPHKGTMCLLDAVEQWDAQSIRCITRTHRSADHPLRRDGHLSSLHLAEYGAQAMAVHGGLQEVAAGRQPRPGMLVALRNIELTVARIDDIAEALTVTARRLVANDGGWLYAFEVLAGDRRLARGRIGVIPIASQPLGFAE
jgi:predicted hotdog family 3-hydroxylacyl-ACP dehydratase